MHSRSGFRQYFNSSDWAYRIIRWFLGDLFIYAGAMKLPDPESFAVLIDAYSLVPDRLLMPIAVGLPTLEVLAGAGLLFEDMEAIASIPDRFAEVLRHPETDPSVKKQIVRILVEEVLVDHDEETNKLHMTIHWKGGVHTQVEFRKTVTAGSP